MSGNPQSDIGPVLTIIVLPPPGTFGTCPLCGCCGLAFRSEKQPLACAGALADPEHCCGWAGSNPLPNCVPSSSDTKADVP